MKKPMLTRDEVNRSVSMDRGALATRIYRQCKKEGLMIKDGSPSNEAIRKLNESLDKFDREHVVNSV